MSSTGSDSPVPARAELDQREQGAEGNQEQALKEQARDQEKAQKQSLAAGKRVADKKAAAASRKLARQGNMAVLRDGNVNGPSRGRVDNMTRRDDSDVNEGHFCYIDYSDAKVRKMVADQMAPEGSALANQGFEPGLGSADYGVYLQPGELDPDTSYPLTAIVLLRDEHAMQVVVPYDAIKPAPQGGRR